MKRLAICLLLFLGCGEHPSPPALQTVAAPDQVQADGHAWTKQSALTPAGERLLTEYFRRNPSVAENPLVNGEPRPYVQKQKTRYYWLSATDGQVNWFFLEFDRDRFVSTGEGSGAPFTTAE